MTDGEKLELTSSPPRPNMTQDKANISPVRHKYCLFLHICLYTPRHSNSGGVGGGNHALNGILDKMKLHVKHWYVIWTERFPQNGGRGGGLLISTIFMMFLLW